MNCLFLPRSSMMKANLTSTPVPLLNSLTSLLMSGGRGEVTEALIDFSVISGVTPFRHRKSMKIHL